MASLNASTLDSEHLVRVGPLEVASHDEADPPAVRFLRIAGPDDGERVSDLVVGSPRRQR